MVSEWRKYFGKLKGKVTSAAREITKWCGMGITLEGESVRWGGRCDIARVGWLGSGECLWDMCLFPLSMLSLLQKARNGNCKGCL